MVSIEIDELGSNSHGSVPIDLVLTRSTRSMTKVAYFRAIRPNSPKSINLNAVVEFWSIDDCGNWWPDGHPNVRVVAGDDVLGLPA